VHVERDAPFGDGSQASGKRPFDIAAAPTPIPRTDERLARQAVAGRGLSACGNLSRVLGSDAVGKVMQRFLHIARGRETEGAKGETRVIDHGARCCHVLSSAAQEEQTGVLPVARHRLPQSQIGRCKDKEPCGERVPRRPYSGRRPVIDTQRSVNTTQHAIEPANLGAGTRKVISPPPL
jgi:hypothetical protein